MLWKIQPYLSWPASSCPWTGPAGTGCRKPAPAAGDNRKDGADGGTVLNLEDADDQLEERGGAEAAFDQRAGLQSHGLGGSI